MTEAVTDSVSPEGSTRPSPAHAAVPARLGRPGALGTRLVQGAIALSALGTVGGTLIAATHWRHATSSSTEAKASQGAVPTQAAATQVALRAPAATTPRPVDVAVSAAGDPLANLPPARAASPEGRLITVYRAIADHRMREALTLAEALVRDAPTFRLAQLVYGDLLLMRLGQLDGFGGGLQRGDANISTELDQMREEAVRRIAALRERPPAGKLPAQFVLLPKGIRHAIAVDVSRSRLYLFENGAKGPRLVADYYASIGKQGADKLVEGDQRTPLGAYFISEAIDPASLEDRFGAAALALNYPNANDRAMGRTGSGILVHGVPSSTYARAPRATDGCVALANDDLLTIARRIQPRETPVVIAEQLTWVAPEQARSAHADFLQALQGWQDARLKADAAALASFYEPEATAELAAASAPPAPAAKRGRGERGAATLAGFEDVTVLSWNDARPLVVVSFRERRANGRTHWRATHQYWSRGEDGRWKIFSQGPNA